MKKKIAVLHAQIPFVRGGAELMVESLVKQLKQRGFEADLISMPFKWYPENSLYDSMLLWRMIDLSESNGQKIDLVIGTKFPSYGAVHDNKVAWVIHQFRQVYDLYDTPAGYSGQANGRKIVEAVKRFDHKTLSEAKAIYAISKNVTERLKKYNQIDSVPLYHPPALAERYKTGDFGNYIVSVGRLDPLKRNELLIQAIAHCDSGIHAKIAGRGPELGSLQKLAKNLGVDDRVEFLGFVPDEDLLDLYANAFAVFFAPIDEDYGYITLEAFLSGKPVITCTDSGGPLEFVINGENGFICVPDVSNIAEKISTLYETKDLARQFGAFGADCVKGITWDHVVKELTKTL